MTKEEFIELFENTESDLGSVEGDNCFLGLLIMSEYTQNLVHGADHDKVYGPDIEVLTEAGITEDGVVELSKLNWSIEDGYYLMCFV